MEKEAVVSAIRDLTETIGQLLSGAKAAVKESVEQFIDKKITKLFGVTSAYKNILERFDLQTKEEFETHLHHLFRYSEVREAYDDWQDVENEWDALLKDVDIHLEKSGPHSIAQGQDIPLDHPLVDARTGEKTRLKNFLGSCAESGAQSTSSVMSKKRVSLSIGCCAESEVQSTSSLMTKRRRSLSEIHSAVLVLLRHFA